MSASPHEAGTPPLALFAKARPSGEALLEWLRPRIDDAMLREIAAADYGCDRELHLEPLLRIRDGRPPAYVSAWHPREVLELVRWSQPDDPHWQPGGTGMRGHLMRAFACAVLLRSAVEPENATHDSAIPQTLELLWDSVAVIADRDAEERTIALLAWLAQRFPPTRGAWTDGVSCKLAFLLAAFTAMRERWSASEFGELASWVVVEEAFIRRVARQTDGPAWSWLPALSNRRRRCLENLVAESEQLVPVGNHALHKLAWELLTVL